MDLGFEIVFQSDQSEISQNIFFRVVVCII
jgi:hypothetical protein